MHDINFKVIIQTYYYLTKGSLMMTNVKRFMIMAMIVSTQASCTSQDVNNESMILTVKEFALIQTSRILNPLEKAIEVIEKSKDWTIFSNATVPSRTECLQSSAPIFIELIQSIITNYGTSYEVTVPTYFGFSEKNELRIINSADSSLKIITNKNFLSLIKKAIKFFEVEETNASNITTYTSNIIIPITLDNGMIVTSTLHEIEQAIEKAII